MLICIFSFSACFEKPLRGWSEPLEVCIHFSVLFCLTLFVAMCPLLSFIPSGFIVSLVTSDCEAVYVLSLIVWEFLRPKLNLVPLEVICISFYQVLKDRKSAWNKVKLNFQLWHFILCSMNSGNSKSRLAYSSDLSDRLCHIRDQGSQVTLGASRGLCVYPGLTSGHEERAFGLLPQLQWDLSAATPWLDSI